jgi:hypothetical protein
MVLKFWFELARVVCEIYFTCARMMGKCMMNLVFSKRNSGRRPSKVKPRCKRVNQLLVELGKLGGTRRNWG